MEARNLVRSLPEAERLRVVRAAVDAGDAAFVHAITSATTLALTGLGPAEQAIARDMWQRKWHPETVERTARLRKAQAELDRLDNLFSTWANSLFVKENTTIVAAEKSAELASAAMAEAGAS